MSKAHHHVRCIALFLVAFSLASTVHALPVYQNVLPGEYFVVDFQFTDMPFETTGGADILLANGGSVSNGLLSSTVSLFHEGSFVATFNNPMANTFALFKDHSSPYVILGVPADLTPILQGGNGRIEFHPIFDPLVENAFVTYQLVFFGAAQSTGPSSFSDTLIAPQRISSNVVAIPLPPTFALVVIGILGLFLLKGVGLTDSKNRDRQLLLSSILAGVAPGSSNRLPGETSGTNHDFSQGNNCESYSGPRNSDSSLSCAPTKGARSDE